jgi:hypothetical protein
MRIATKEIADLIYRHARRLGVNGFLAVSNVLHFADLVGQIENNGRLVGKNPTSSAKGLYQFINGSIEPAVNRLKRNIGDREWMVEALRHKDANLLTWEEQTLLFLANILEQRGTDQYLRPLFAEGSKEAMISLYYKYHHTNPDEATKERTKKIIYGDGN